MMKSVVTARQDLVQWNKINRDVAAVLIIAIITATMTRANISMKIRLLNKKRRPERHQRIMLQSAISHPDLIEESNGRQIATKGNIGLLDGTIVQGVAATTGSGARRTMKRLV
jgi:hypothetical protein